MHPVPLPLARIRLLVVSLSGMVGSFSISAKEKAKEEPAPIKALLVTGGCSHDYTTRKGIIVQGIRERVRRPVEWMVKHQGEGESNVRIPLFEESAWAQGYDIVVHDYCFPRVSAGDYVDRILAPHRAGLPAVLIHGTMLSFQTTDDRWATFTGATIRGHDRVQPLFAEPLEPANSILKGFQPRTILGEELYRVDSFSPGATALIGGRPLLPTADRQPPTTQPLAWTHLYGPSSTRVFAVTIGNDLSTLTSPDYLDLLARGFLWALKDLSDTTSVMVPPELSLKGLKIAIPPARLPETGSNSARLGRASALASGVTEWTAPDRAIDGKTSTYWESDVPGPASWQVDFREDTRVGAIALLWKEAPPAEFLVEGSANGRSWQVLAEGQETAGELTLLELPVNPVTLRYIRISIPATSPGYVPGIREFAAYPNLSDIPSGLLNITLDVASSPRFLTAGKSGFERRLRLAPGWSIAASAAWPSGDPVQLIPTASGKTFLLTESIVGVTSPLPLPKPNHPPNNGDLEITPTGTTVHRIQGSVHLLDRRSDGTFTHSLFLDKLLPGTVISWDGEWLYTFSGGKLDAFRNVKGDGPANERNRIGSVFSLPKSASFDKIKFTDMELGEDGWFYVHFESPQAWEVYNSRGESVHFPERGMARFHRNGESFSWWRDTDEGKEGVGLHDSDIRSIVQVKGLKTAVRDGHALWMAISDESETTIACLEESSGELFTPVLWDEIGAEALFDFLDSSRLAVRKEVLPEILRRKRNPSSELERELSADPPSDLVTPLLSALTAVNAGRSLELVVQMAQSSDPVRQILAFSHLGSHPRAQNHAIFQQITSTTTPAVTVEILSAILNSKSEIKGIDDLALSFTAHPDPHLALGSKEFLIIREASNTCFEALDDPDRKPHWRGAFEVLSRLHRATVVEGIVLRLEKTTSSEFRRLGLEALCRLYFRDTEAKHTWDGTRIADLFLRASLSDHRVDRTFLFNTLIQYGIPLPEPEVIADLAKKEISLESLAVGALHTAEKPISASTSAWLKELSKSPSRDDDLRIKATEILAKSSQQEVGSERVPSVSDISIEDVLEGMESVSSDLDAGHMHFMRLACDSCHNIHGEGPSSAPDLATSLESLSPKDLVEALLSPAKKISPGYETRLFELKNGLQLSGIVEGRDSNVVSLRDRAGNPFSIPMAEIRFEWTDSRSDMPSNAVSSLTLAEFGSLVQFLKTLSIKPQP